MDYIVAGARITDDDKVGEGHVFSAERPALEKALALEAEGYTVTIQLSDGSKMSIEEFKERVSTEGTH